MSRHERFALLLTHYLQYVKPPPHEQEVFECLDCLLSLPESAIPDRTSLRWFIAGMVRHFFGEEDCRPHYRRAARHVDRWKASWLPREPARFPARLAKS